MSAKMKYEILKESADISERELKRLLKEKNVDIEKDANLLFALQRLLDTYANAKNVQSEFTLD